MLNRNYMHDIAGIWIQRFQKSEFSQQKKLETFHMAIAVVAVVANFPPNQRPNPIPNFACAPADEH